MAMTKKEQAAFQAAIDRAEYWRHVANEWADIATNGYQHLRNVEGGFSTPNECAAALKKEIDDMRASMRNNTNTSTSEPT